jgi:hypothetical protein
LLVFHDAMLTAAEYPQFKADARRLGLLPADPEAAFDQPDVAVRVGPGAAPGRVRVSIAEAEREVNLDQFARTLREPLASTPGVPVLVTIAKGIPAEDLLKLFHALVDLRTDIPQMSPLALEARDELEKIKDKLGGRLKLLTAEVATPVAGTLNLSTGVDSVPVAPADATPGRLVDAVDPTTPSPVGRSTETNPEKP